MSMEYRRGKLFINKDNQIFLRNMPEGFDYYGYIKEEMEKGFRQFIVTSNLMIDLIINLVRHEKLLVFAIEFAKKNSQNNKRIRPLLIELEEDRLALIDLVDELRLITEKDSIEIKNIWLQDSFDEDNKRTLLVHSNGIVIIDEDNYEPLGERTVDIITKSW